MTLSVFISFAIYALICYLNCLLQDMKRTITIRNYSVMPRDPSNMLRIWFRNGHIHKDFLLNLDLYAPIDEHRVVRMVVLELGYLVFSTKATWTPFRTNCHAAIILNMCMMDITSHVIQLGHDKQYWYCILT